MATTPAQHPALPLERIAGFASLLREHGLVVGIAEQRDMVQAALLLGALQERALSAAWRAIACQDARQWALWADLFGRYWHPHKVRGSSRVSGQMRASRDLRSLVQQLHAGGHQDAAPDARPTAPTGAGDLPANGDGTDAGAPRAQGGASRTEPLTDRSGQQWLPQDLAMLRQLARRITAGLVPRATRRWQLDPHGTRLDLRRTLRRSLAHGGVPLAPAWSSRRVEPPRLFILADVSRSMEAHAQLFLRIARAFALEAGARVFVFHTRLAEVTPLMQRDTPAVQEKVNAVTAGFGAGTRIASCLHDFATRHARAQLGRGSRVWVMSDGFDTDPPEQLAQVLHAIRARGARISWFHPTRQPPAAQALQGAASCIERCLPLASLADLAAARTRLH